VYIYNTCHSKRTSCKKAVHLLAVMQGQVADILHSVPASLTYEDTVGVLKGHYGDHQLVADVPAQLKNKIQLVGESLQELGAAVEQLTYRALVE
jgi:hypothetical protein